MKRTILRHPDGRVAIISSPRKFSPKNWAELTILAEANAELTILAEAEQPQALRYNGQSWRDAWTRAQAWLAKLHSDGFRADGHTTEDSRKAAPPAQTDVLAQRAEAIRARLAATPPAPKPEQPRTRKKRAAAPSAEAQTTEAQTTPEPPRKPEEKTEEKTRRLRF